MVSRRHLLNVAIAGGTVLVTGACAQNAAEQARSCAFVPASAVAGRENATGRMRVCSPSRLRRSAVDRYFERTEDGRFVAR